MSKKPIILTTRERLHNMKIALLADSFRDLLIDLGCEEHVKFIELDIKEQLKHYSAKILTEEMEEDK